MKFSLYVLLGIWLWSGIFLLPQIEAQTLREELKEELRKELKEELRKELQEELKEEERTQEIKQEIREHLLIPCRKAWEKRDPLAMRQHKDTLDKFFREFESILMKGLSEKRFEDKDLRMGLYYAARRKCEQQFKDQ